MSKKVAVIMGSDSDLPVVKGALDELDKFGMKCMSCLHTGHRHWLRNLPETRRKTASA